MIASVSARPAKPMQAAKATAGAVALIYWETMGVAEANLAKVVEFLGGRVILFRVTGETPMNCEALESVVTASGRVMVSARALAGMSAKVGGRGDWLRVFLRGATHALIYGFEPSEVISRVLQGLTASSLVGVGPSPSTGCRVSVAADSQGICRQFAGLSFNVPGAAGEFVFKAGSEQLGETTLVSIEQSPFFVQLKGDGCQTLLLASREIADLERAVPRGTSLVPFFPSLAPVIMFLHWSGGGEYWQNNEPMACLVVDDPLLRRHYGFLDYEELFAAMERERFCTSIAFIPWNFRRSDRQMAAQFAARSHRYSLCVHGCDHTRGEFGASDDVLLRQKAEQALERMRRHQALTGVKFDQVMVFPQCIFSLAAMNALRSSGYLAVVNSSEFPIDGGDQLALRDLLEAAVTKFSGVPLFIRRAAGNLAEIAFDLFLGKPALLVEHHGFFRDGYELLAETVRSVNSLDPRLQWANLATICSRACVQRSTANGDVQVRFFTDRFFLRNASSQTQKYRVSRRTRTGEAVRAVTIKGEPLDSIEERDRITVRLSLAAGQTAEIKLERDQPEPRRISSVRDRVYETKVFIRRHLCEFRDNYINKSLHSKGSFRKLRPLRTSA